MTTQEIQEIAQQVVSYLKSSGSVSIESLPTEEQASNILAVLGLNTKNEMVKVSSDNFGGGSYTLPVATTDTLGGIVANESQADTPIGTEYGVRVFDDGKAYVLIPHPEDVVAEGNTSAVSSGAVYDELKDTVRYEDTAKEVENIDEHLAATALRKTPQVLTEEEKDFARENIQAQKELTLTVKDNGNIVIWNIQGEIKEFMPATPSGDPLHYEYINSWKCDKELLKTPAFGNINITAESIEVSYNDTNVDIVKDTPWRNMIDDIDYLAQHDINVVSGDVHNLVYNGENYEYIIDDDGRWKIIQRVGDKLIWDDSKVIHRKGCWYINGLGDVTNEEMALIYRTATFDKKILDKAYQGMYNGRTIITYANYRNGVGNMSYTFYGNTIIETLVFINGTLWQSLENCFYRCPVRYILPIVSGSYIKSNTNINGDKIIVLFIDKLSNSIKISSASISKKSILRIIQKATPTSAITITLHADAYARLVEDEDIVEALSTQPLVSLVSI